MHQCIIGLKSFLFGTAQFSLWANLVHTHNLSKTLARTHTHTRVGNKPITSGEQFTHQCSPLYS